MTTMRAKMQVQKVELMGTVEVLHLSCVAKTGAYPADGSNEDNTFAKWTPSGSLQLSVTNPALHGKFKPGMKFYLDFTEAPA